MGRKLRYIPDGGALVEVTCRTLHGRLLLRPSPEHLSPEAYRGRVAKMGLEIEEEAAVIRRRTGAHPFGAAKILAQHPWTRPERVKRSPAPLFHAAGQVMRHYLWEGFAWFVAVYRTAAEKLQRGDPNPRFPVGSFPPALPFVGG